MSEMKENYDLRHVIEILKRHEGQYLEMEKEVDAKAEICGIYRKMGARGTVRRPTKLGPALMFNNIRDYPQSRIFIGALGRRERVGLELGIDPKDLGSAFWEAAEHPIPPVVNTKEVPLCQEYVFRADEPGFDIRKILPAPMNTLNDAGPYITMGLCYAHDPVSKDANIAVHRICIQDKDTLTIGFGGARHLAKFKDTAKELHQPLPISVNIGTDPAIYISSCFQAPTTPLGYDELGIAGAIRKQPVELAPCVTINEYAIANAEYVIEGEIYTDQTMAEDSTTHSGRALPEFGGYNGEARNFPILKVKAVTCRKNPIMQICIGSSEEHVNMAGIAQEASILKATRTAFGDKIVNVYNPPGGGGKLMSVIQFRKDVPEDEGKQRQAALQALGACNEVKNIFLVDEDVDIYDADDVFWAFTTRFKPELDMSVISNVKCHKADPTQKKYYDPAIRQEGIGSKTIYDCTVPFDVRDKMMRPDFMDVDLKNYW